MKDRRVHRVVTVCVLAAMAAGIAGGIFCCPLWIFKNPFAIFQ